MKYILYGFIIILFILGIFFLRDKIFYKDNNQDIFNLNQISLPKDTIKEISVNHHNITIKKRNYNSKIKENQQNNISESFYIPKEASIKIRQDIEGNLEIKIKDKGICFTPYLAILFDNIATSNLHLNLAFGVRLFYFKYYSLGFAFTDKKEIGVSFERKIKEISFLDNTSVLLFLSKNKITLGFSLSF